MPCPSTAAPPLSQPQVHSPPTPSSRPILVPGLLLIRSVNRRILSVVANQWLWHALAELRFNLHRSPTVAWLDVTTPELNVQTIRGSSEWCDWYPCPAARDMFVRLYEEHAIGGLLPMDSRGNCCRSQCARWYVADTASSDAFYCGFSNQWVCLAYAYAGGL